MLFSSEIPAIRMAAMREIGDWVRSAKSGPSLAQRSSLSIFQYAA